MVGMQVVVTKCDDNGNEDMADLQAKCEQHSANLACVMITYPSTHGVFETQVKELCAMVHQHGGRVYVDGANMNALVGVAAPCGMQKVLCRLRWLTSPPNSPGHAAGGLPVNGVGAISAAPLGNAAVLPISWMYTVSYTHLTLPTICSV